MSSVTTLEIVSTSSAATLALGKALGRSLKGGEVVELIGDLGAGKTALVRGLAQGINSHHKVQSPTFTVARIYEGKVAGQRIAIHHFDFHRLAEGGIVGQELNEWLAQPGVTTVIEWSQAVKSLLPVDRLQIVIEIKGEHRRLFKFAAGPNHQHLIRAHK